MGTRFLCRHVTCLQEFDCAHLITVRYSRRRYASLSKLKGSSTLVKLIRAIPDEHRIGYHLYVTVAHTDFPNERSGKLHFQLEVGYFDSRMRGRKGHVQYKAWLSRIAKKTSSPKVTSRTFSDKHEHTQSTVSFTGRAQDFDERTPATARQVFRVLFVWKA